ncbi:MAG: ABC transporter ATP-binding protein [Coriobacteriia bacterium]|nr:ABC transporter ATP-binding protein [Coriobacteriia bacterium]MCL2137430.1 ABC transporter ATP-binding protein [Coriobacteriia bacterium]
MPKVLEIENLHKSFNKTEALRGASLTVSSGQIVGLLGPNASGKTTLLKTIAGLYQPTSGEVRYYAVETGGGGAAGCSWDGGGGAATSSGTAVLPGSNARSMVSFCPDNMAFPRWMCVNDAFAFYQEMYLDYSPARAEELVLILELTSFMDTPIHRLSKGIRERLVLALSLSRETSLYMLDEPLDGIDPVGKTLIIDALLSMKPPQASMLISTHQVKDIERVFDSVFFLSKGAVVFAGDCDALRAERGQTVEQVYLEVFINEGAI